MTDPWHERAFNMTANLSLAAWGGIKITLGGSEPRACVLVQVAFQAMQRPVIFKTRSFISRQAFSGAISPGALGAAVAFTESPSSTALDQL